MGVALFYVHLTRGMDNFATSKMKSIFLIMENTEEKKSENLKDVETDDAVLKFLAANHPDDEAALDEITRLLNAENREALIEAVYKGIRADAAVAAADEGGYLRGRNEAVEMRRQETAPDRPKDDGGASETTDLPLLRNIRRSVWD